MKKKPRDKAKLRRDLEKEHRDEAIPGNHMHEFPFNATQQASVDDSSVRWVSPFENWVQGSLYYGNWFIRKQLGSKDGAPFLVVPIPKEILGD